MQLSGHALHDRPLQRPSGFLRMAARNLPVWCLFFVSTSGQLKGLPREGN